MTSLAAKYRAWDAMQVEDDEGQAKPSDLDALVGPAYEVEAIKKHWREQDRQQTASCTAPDRPITTAQPHHSAAPPPSSPQPLPTPPTPTPQSTRTDAFKKWDSFDADKVILDLDNQDRKDPEEADVMLKAGGGAMGVEYVGYKKDMEEHLLDQELHERTQGLQRGISTRMHAAARARDDGNRYFKAGNYATAAAEYEKGAQAMEYCITATAVMAPSLKLKVEEMATALFSNLSQAYLKSSRWEEAEASATRALEISPETPKAIFRRCTARFHKGDLLGAAEDMRKLDAKDPAVARLASEMRERDGTSTP